MPFCGLRKSIATALLGCFWPHASSDEQQEKADNAYKEYLSSGNPKDLKTALQNYKSAYSARSTDGHPELAETEVNYATALWSDYERTGRPSDQLSQIIDLDNHALTLWRQSSPKPEGYPVLLSNLARARYHQYLATQDRYAIDQAIQLCDELRQSSSVPDAIRRQNLTMLGTALSTRCHLDKTPERMDEAINYLLTEAKRGIPKKDGDRENDTVTLHADCLLKLATAYNVRYDLFNGTPKDLNDAIKYNGLAKEFLQGNPDELALCLYNLARQHFKRYQNVHAEGGGGLFLGSQLNVNKGMEDLNAAKQSAREAQGLLAAHPESPVKQAVDKLLDVAEQHSEAASRAPSVKAPKSRSASRQSMRDN